eukprot:2997525-Pleurochrysis_carterae.AAC.1
MPAVDACRGGMPWMHAVDECRGGMQWRHGIDAGRHARRNPRTPPVASFLSSERSVNVATCESARGRACLNGGARLCCS